MAAMRRGVEYIAAWVALKTMGFLPRPLARAAGSALAAASFLLRPPLRRAAHINLRMAFPQLPENGRRRLMRRMVRNIGWMAAEFSQFPKYTRENIERIAVMDGFENFEAAQRKGRGVLFATGHTGAWELAPFAQALYGHPLHFLVRPLDNARVDALVNSYRCLSGNSPIEKNKAARLMLSVLRDGGTIGVLIDQNTALEEGVFVDYFGIPACTTTGLARVALRTGAAVVPGFLYWDEQMRKYRLRFEPEIPLVRSGDEERDVRENTASFTRAVEDFVRRHPDQWLWVHRRWKTRPPGEPSFYS
jgi:KDO2-lipid IV(A) lauroyltransferase